MPLAGFLLTGLCAGLLSGLFGIGGGVLIVPALVYGMGFSLATATGTSLAILLPPVGLAAALEYWRAGHVDLRAAVTIALALMAGGWIGARLALRLDPLLLKLLFGVFLLAMGGYVILDALRGTR